MAATPLLTRDGEIDSPDVTILCQHRRAWTGTLGRRRGAAVRLRRELVRQDFLRSRIVTRAGLVIDPGTTSFSMLSAYPSTAAATSWGVPSESARRTATPAPLQKQPQPGRQVKPWNRSCSAIPDFGLA